MKDIEEEEAFIIQNHNTMIDITKTREGLTEKQLLKLSTAAEMLKQTSGIYADLTNHPMKTSLLPLWAAGIVTHGQPKITVGITQEAKKAKKQSTKNSTKDHLYRVTATAEYILTRAAGMTPKDIEDVLLQRSVVMETTREENNYILKKALDLCENKDDWRELYRKAGVEFELYPPFHND